MAPVRRGSDWLDGAFAGWLMVSAVQAAGAVGRDGVPNGVASVAAAALLGGAVLPFLRTRRAGWALAAAGLLVHAALGAVRAEAALGAGAFAPLLPHLAALGYLAWVLPEFRHPPAPAVPAAPSPHQRADDPAPTEMTPPHPALAAIHRRIAAGGSACDVEAAEVRAIAREHGLDADALAREGVVLYSTFQAHFLASGPLRPEQARELECLERILGIGARAEHRAHPAAPDPGVPLLPEERCLAVREVELYRLPPAEAAAGSLATVGPPRRLHPDARTGACRLVLTDRRLLLVAPSGQQSPLPLERVAHAAARANGLEVHPVRGPAVFVCFEHAVEGAAAALQGALQAARAIPHPPEGT